MAAAVGPGEDGVSRRLGRHFCFFGVKKREKKTFWLLMIYRLRKRLIPNGEEARSGIKRTRDERCGEAREKEGVGSPERRRVGYETRGKRRRRRFFDAALSAFLEALFRALCLSTGGALDRLGEKERRRKGPRRRETEGAFFV